MAAPRTLYLKARTAARQVVDHRTSTPSFTYKDAEMRRLARLAGDLGVREPVWSVNDKDDSAAWADRLGVRRPALLAQVPSAAELVWDDLPASCVVKPVHGADSRGVHLLQRAGAGWRDVRTGRTTTAAEVVADLEDLAGRGRTSREVRVEELVEDPQRPGAPPVDWKVLTFYGRVGLVAAKATGVDAEGRPTAGFRFFDEDLRDAGAAFKDHRMDRTIAPPRSGSELLDLARRISAAVPRPFLRVDLYDGLDGPVFGEITPHPGWRMRIRRDVDRRLGELWEDAEARLAVRVTATGVLLPEAAPASADDPAADDPAAPAPAAADLPRGARAA